MTSLPPLTAIDALFLASLINLYTKPQRWWDEGRPTRNDGSWIGPVFKAWRFTIESATSGYSKEFAKLLIQQLWGRFLDWHFLMLGLGFKKSMLSNRRFASVHAHVAELKKQGLLPHTPVDEKGGLLNRVIAESRRKGTALPDDLSLGDVWSKMVDGEDSSMTAALTTNLDGEWILNVQLLYDRLRDRRRNKATAAPQQEVEDLDTRSPADPIIAAELARETRDLLDEFREKGGAPAQAAVDRLLSGASREHVAARHGVSVGKLRVAEQELEGRLSALRRRLGVDG